MDIRVLRFFTKINAAGKSVDWVEYASGHSIQSATNIKRVSDLQPKEDDESRDIPGTSGYHQAAVWSFIGPHYDAWKDGKDMPDEGVALSAWPAIGEAEIYELNKVGVKSVEDVARMNEQALSKVGVPNARAMRKQAELFLEAMNASSAANKIKEQDDVIAEMAERLAVMEELLNEAGQPNDETTKDDASDAEKGKQPVKEGQPNASKQKPKAKETAA